MNRKERLINNINFRISYIKNDLEKFNKKIEKDIYKIKKQIKKVEKLI